MCIAAAERVAPVFRRLGRPQSIATFEAALDAAWAAVASGTVVAVGATLRRLPENKADDSHSAEYYAHRALHILQLALTSMTIRGGRSSRRCLDELVDLCDDIDTLLSTTPGQTFRHDPENPSPPGEVESFEARVQAETVEWLRQVADPRPALIESLRRRARQQASIYDVAAVKLPGRLAS